MSVLQAEHFVREFIRVNTRISRRFERYFFPHAGENYRKRYISIAAQHLPADVSVVLDLGGGNSSRFASDVIRDRSCRLIAVDASPLELARNKDVDETVVADITQRLPFPDECADVGALPKAVREHALRLVFSDYTGVLGYPAHYDCCDPPRIAKELERAGLELLVEERSYYGAYYFHGFAPLAVLVLLVESTAQRLGVRALAVQSLFVAQKPKETLPGKSSE